jgi:hypothetical protein
MEIPPRRVLPPVDPESTWQWHRRGLCVPGCIYCVKVARMAEPTVGPYPKGRGESRRLLLEMRKAMKGTRGHN